MADARPFHWEFKPEPVPPRGLPDRGRPSAERLRPDQRLEERRPQAARRGDPDRRALPVHQRARDRGCPGHGRHPARPGRGRRPSGSRTSTRSPRATSTGCSCRSRRRPRCAPAFILLGPLLARFGRVIISNPGGDRIGRRPVNLHVDAMRALGAEIEYRNGYYFARSPGRLRGTELRFPLVSVMGTENAMLAAVLADGRTTIRPAAEEPEVDDLIAFLRTMGAEIERTAPDTIEIVGRQAPARRRAPGPARPDRGRHVRRGRRRDRRPDHPRERPLRPPRRVPRGARADRGRRPLRGRTIEASGVDPATCSGRSTSPPRPTRAWPPTSSRRCACC